MRIETVQVIPSEDGMQYLVISGTRRKTFTGESAWSDAERYANDELAKRRGSPFGEQFVL